MTELVKMPFWGVYLGGPMIMYSTQQCPSLHVSLIQINDPCLVTMSLSQFQRLVFKFISSFFANKDGCYLFS